MKKTATHPGAIRLIAALMLTYSAMLLPSCESTPAPHTKEGTLLAIPALYFSTAPVNLQTNVYYNLSVYNLSTNTKYNVRFPSYKGDDYILVDFLPEGTYRFTDFESKGLSTNIQRTLLDPVDFHVSKGSLTISPYKWVSRIDENPKTKFHTYYIDGMIINEKQRERIMNFFRKNPDYAAWVKEDK